MKTRNPKSKSYTRNRWHFGCFLLLARNYVQNMLLWELYIIHFIIHFWWSIQHYISWPFHMFLSGKYHKFSHFCTFSRSSCRRRCRQRLAHFDFPSFPTLFIYLCLFIWILIVLTFTCFDFFPKNFRETYTHIHYRMRCWGMRNWCNLFNSQSCWILFICMWYKFTRVYRQLTKCNQHSRNY